MPSFRVRYHTKEFNEVDIHVRTLRDTQQYYDKKNVAEKIGISSATWSLFGVVWPSGEVLAHHMFEYDIKDKRILEVGCGIGLASLILNHRNADITATDYHPDAEDFLIQNTQLNNGKEIPFIRTGWGDDVTTLGSFDVIIGSDILYDRGHPELLSQFIEQHAKKTCEVIIVDPQRQQQNIFGRLMNKIGFIDHKVGVENTDYLLSPFKGSILTYRR